MRAEHFSVKSLFLDPNGIFSPAGHKNGVRAQRGKRPKGAQSFLTAENQIGAVVFTYFNINNCEADNSLVVRGGNSVVFGSFSEKYKLGILIPEMAKSLYITSSYSTITGG